MPSAPTGLSALGSKRLSFQISRAKKSRGRPWLSACDLDQVADAADGDGIDRPCQAGRHGPASLPTASAPTSHPCGDGRSRAIATRRPPCRAPNRCFDIVGDHLLELCRRRRRRAASPPSSVDEHRRRRRLAGAGQRNADVGVLGFARPVDDAAHHRDLQRLDARIALAPLRHVACGCRPGSPWPAPGTPSRSCARSPGRPRRSAGTGGSPWSAAVPAPPAPRGVRSPPGSGVSEMRMVSPMPCCSRMPIAADEATMPLEPMPASVRPRCSA